MRPRTWECHCAPLNCGDVPVWITPCVLVASLPLTPIGPNQYFYGEVNDQAGHATIRMACFGPTHPGQTGHPLAGQPPDLGCC
ncbi:MAG: hypothetical protein ACRDRO_11935 [Pseudonocardiaceae bacterium]